MMFKRVFGRAFCLSMATMMAGSGLFCASAAHATTLRIVNWNIEADLNADGTGTFADNGSVTGLQTVLAGIGTVQLSDNGVAHAQAPDAIALEEVGATSSALVSTPSATELTALVTALNSTYGANTYAYSNAQDPTTGSGGGGPSALIYNTKTVSVVSAAAIGTSSGSGAARAPLQFVLQPVGYSTTASYTYLDVVHSKSGTDSDSESRRGIEATTIVNNTNSLGTAAHVITLGDFNSDAGSLDTGYQNLVGTSTTTGTFTDIANPAKNFTNSATFSNLLSEQSYKVQYRDDYQLVSASAKNGSGVAGAQYDLGSFTVFGNLGASSLYKNNVTSQTGAFSGLTTAQTSAILLAEGGSGSNNTNNDAASDHLPFVADYDIVGIATPEPGNAFVLMGFAMAIGLLHRCNRLAGARDETGLRSQA